MREIVRKLFTTFLVLYGHYLNSKIQCIYLVEENPVNFSCPPLGLFKQFYCSVIISGISVLAASCSITTCTSTPGVTTTVNSTGVYFTVTFGHFEELRAVSHIVCSYDRSLDIIENVSIISKPVKPICDPPKLEDEIAFISLTCRTTKVYPQAQCIFFINKLLFIPGTIIYTHNNTLINNLQYYQSECTWNISLNNFEAGNFTTEIIMYPDVQNGSQYGVLTSLLDIFQFTLPNLRLSSECYNTSNNLQGYIIPNHIINCLCYLETTGFPPGTVQWINGNSMEVGMPLNSTSSMLILTSSTGSNKYYCVSSSSLTKSNRTLPYDISFADIPAVKKFVLLNESSIINNGTWTEMMCEAEGNPTPKLFIIKNNTILHQNISGYTLSFGKLMVCTDGGIYTCQADNGVYTAESNLKRSKNVSMNVMCPLQVRNPEEIQQNFTYGVGSQFHTNFDIYGYPEPNNFTVYKYNSILKMYTEGGFLKNQDNQFECVAYKMTIKYTPQESPYGNIDIQITDLTYTDFTTYLLIIQLNEIPNLTYKFHVIQGESKLPNQNTHVVAAAVGGTIAAVVIILLVIALFFIRRKYECICRKQKRNIKRDINNYSDISASEQPQDIHQYETPKNSSYMMNEHVSNYVNMSGNFNEQTPYENINGQMDKTSQ